MIQSSACQPWHVDPPGLAGEHGGFVGTYTISWDTILRKSPPGLMRKYTETERTTDMRGPIIEKLSDEIGI
jgi:hypothetical protein